MLGSAKDADQMLVKWVVIASIIEECTSTILYLNAHTFRSA